MMQQIIFISTVLAALTCSGCGLGFLRNQEITNTSDESVVLVASWVDLSPMTNLHRYSNKDVDCYMPETGGIWCLDKRGL